MAKKVRDVVVKVGEYQDRNTGETKARWQNVGSMMKNEEDNSFFVILDRTFNPAGVPNPDNRSNVILSCFVPQDQREGNQQQSQGGGYGGGQGGGYGGGQQQSQSGQQQSRDLDDEIPF